MLVDPWSDLGFGYLVRDTKGPQIDSGGTSEDTMVMGVTCMTLRTSTERPETVSIGTDCLGWIPHHLRRHWAGSMGANGSAGSPGPLGPKASERIVAVLEGVLPLSSVSPP